MNGMQGHTMGDAEWHRQHQANRTVRETMEAEIRFWRNRYEQLSESLHETLKAASPPLLLTHRESYEAGRLVGGRDSATRIKALEEVLHEARFVLEPFADIKPRLWKTDMEKAIRALKRIDEVLK